MLAAVHLDGVQHSWRPKLAQTHVGSCGHYLNGLVPLSLLGHAVMVSDAPVKLLPAALPSTHPRDASTAMQLRLACIMHVCALLVLRAQHSRS